MSLLHSITDPKFTGNCKRILELYEIGQRPEAIVQAFREQGINISINTVYAVLKNEIEEMRRKAFPKSIVKNKKQEAENIKASIKV